MGVVDGGDSGQRGGGDDVDGVVRGQVHLVVVALLLLLDVVVLVIHFAVQSVPLSVFVFVFALPLTPFAVHPSLLPLPFTSSFFNCWDPLLSRDHPQSDCARKHNQAHLTL